MKKHHSKHNKKKNMVVSHLKKDMGDFEHEIAEDKALIKKLDHKNKDPKKKDPKPKTKVGKRNKVEKVMHEYKEGKLHSGSKHGPQVTNPKQAIAIAMSESGQSANKSKKKKSKHAKKEKR